MAVYHECTRGGFGDFELQSEHIDVGYVIFVVDPSIAVRVLQWAPPQLPLAAKPWEHRLDMCHSTKLLLIITHSQSSCLS